MTCVSDFLAALALSSNVVGTAEILPQIFFVSLTDSLFFAIIECLPVFFIGQRPNQIKCCEMTKIWCPTVPPLDIENRAEVRDRVRTATAIAGHNFRIAVFCYAKRGSSADETNQIQIAVCLFSHLV